MALPHFKQISGSGKGRGGGWSLKLSEHINILSSCQIPVLAVIGCFQIRGIRGHMDNKIASYIMQWYIKLIKLT